MSEKNIYSFTKEDIIAIDKIKQKYPKILAATLPVLWYAQDKFGHVNTDVQQLVAKTLDIPSSHVYGVASFYTQYYKEQKGKYVLDVCTCLSCHLCGGYDIVDYLKDKLKINVGETTADGLFTLQEVECLGACAYAPMLQITNDKYVQNLTPQKIDTLIDDLKNGKEPSHEIMPMKYLKKERDAK